MNLFSQTIIFFIFAIKQPSLKRVLAAGSFLLVADLFLLAIFWWPSAWHHHELQKQIDTVRSRQREAQQAQETARDYTLLLKRVKTLEGKLETPATQSQLIGSLTRLASQNGLRVLSQDFDAVKNGPAQSFKQNMSVEGTYTSVRHYLNDLENLPTLTLMQQIRLEKAGEGSGQVRALLTLLTFEKSTLRVR